MRRFAEALVDVLAIIVAVGIAVMLALASGCRPPAPASPRAGHVVNAEMSCFLADTTAGTAFVCLTRMAPCRTLYALVDAHEDAEVISPECVELEVVATEPDQ